MLFFLLFEDFCLRKQEAAHEGLKLLQVPQCRWCFEDIIHVSRSLYHFGAPLSLFCLFSFERSQIKANHVTLCSAPEESFCFLFNYVSFFITIILETVAHWMVFKAEPFFLECRGLDDLIWFGNESTVLQLEWIPKSDCRW